MAHDEEDVQKQLGNLSIALLVLLGVIIITALVF